MMWRNRQRMRARRGELLDGVGLLCAAGAGRVGVWRLVRWRGREWAMVESVMGVAVPSFLTCITARRVSLIGHRSSSSARTGPGQELGVAAARLRPGFARPRKHAAAAKGLRRERASLVGAERSDSRAVGWCRGGRRGRAQLRKAAVAAARSIPAKGRAPSVSGCTAHGSSEPWYCTSN